MEKGDGIDQFQILESKVESLIKYVDSLKKEKEILAEKVLDLEQKVAGMGAEVKRLHSARDQAKERIVKLLQKIEQAGV